MAPPRTGSVDKLKRTDGTSYFRARIRLADDTRERVDVPERLATAAGGATARERAEMYVAALQEREDEGGENGPLLVAKREREAENARKADLLHGETWDRWFKRYLAVKECGESYRRISGSVGSKWISSVIGSKPMASLTRDDVEDVRDNLDRALDSKEIRHATARNAWATFTGALKAACSARDRSLRVLAAPIHFGVLPPKRGESRQRPWLYPREWLAFATSAAPVTFRQVCAVALYTGLRPGELRALTWADVDLGARTISVSKAIDSETDEVKPPKTRQGQRIIPIHDALVPLLKALAGDDDVLVLGAFNASEDHMAPAFREHLANAGLDRPRLTADNATEEPIDFRSLRDTHATWLALAGTPDKVIQRRMGHASPTTTDRYVKAAETFATEHVGTPFPPLPTSLLTTDWATIGPSWKRGPKTSGKLVARVGFEPTTFGL
jgi:integrase